MGSARRVCVSAECSQQDSVGCGGMKTYQSQLALLHDVCNHLSRNHLWLGVALPQTVSKTVVQDTQFQIAVHYDVVHIVFYIRFCTYLLHTSLMQSNVIAGRLFCY